MNNKTLNKSKEHPEQWARAYLHFIFLEMCLNNVSINSLSNELIYNAHFLAVKWSSRLDCLAALQTRQQASDSCKNER